MNPNYLKGIGAGFLIVIGARFFLVGQDEPGAIEVPMADRVVSIEVPIEDCDNVCDLTSVNCNALPSLSDKEALCCFIGADHARTGAGRQIIGMVSHWEAVPFMSGGVAKCMFHITQTGKQRAAVQLLPPGQKAKLDDVLGADLGPDGGW